VCPPLLCHSICDHIAFFENFFLRDVDESDLIFLIRFGSINILFYDAPRAMNGQRATYSSGCHHIHFINKWIIWMFAMLLCVVILNCYFCHFNLSRVFCVKFLFLSTFEFLPRKIMKIQSHPLCTLFLLYVICHFAMKFCSSFLCCWFVDVFPPKWFREKLPNRYPILIPITITIPFWSRFISRFWWWSRLCFQSFPPWFLLYILCCFPLCCV